MAREFSVVVGINATRAIAGGRQFKAGADQVNRSNAGMQRSTSRTTKRMTAMITTMGRVRGVASLMFAGFLGVGGISAVIRTLTQFTGALSKVEALLGDRAIGGAMAALEDRARSLGATTVFTATQAAEGMQFLTLAGFNALEVFQAIGPALELAQAGAIGLGQAADIVSNIMAGFSIEASRTGEVVDALAFVASRTNTNIQQLGEAMKFVAPVAGAVGISVQETAAALGILGNAGLQASLAGTSLRRVFSGLLNPSKEATQVLGGMNLVAQDLVDKIGKPGGLNEVVEILAKRGLGAAEAFTLFGQRGAPGILSLINQREKLGKMNILMEDIVGTAKDMATVMTDNLGGDARLAISALQEGILQLGDAGLTDWLRETTQGFGGFIRGLTGVKINMVTATDAMKEGVASGERFKENIVSIKRALVVLTVFMMRRTVVAIATMTYNLVAGAVAWVTYGSAIAATVPLTAAATAGLIAWRAALIATGVGAIVLVLGYIASLILVQDDLESTNVSTALSYDDLNDKVGIAAFNFDTLSAAERELQIVNVELKRTIDELSFAKLTEEIEKTKQATLDEAAAVVKLDAAKKALRDRGLEDLSADDAAASASREIIMLMNDRTLAHSALDVIQRQLAKGSTLELQAEQGRLRREIDLGTERLGIYAIMQKDTNLTLTEATAIYKKNSDAVKEFNAELLKTTGLTVDELTTLEGLIKKYDKAHNSVTTLADGMALVETRLSALIKEGKGASDQAEQLRRVLLAMAEAAGKKAAKALEELTKAQESVRDKMAKTAAGTDKVKLATVAHIIEIRNLRREMILAEIPILEQAAALKVLNEQHMTNIETLKLACEETDTLTACMDDNSKAMEAIWDQAMRNIQDSFADAFRNIGDGFDSFADGILNAFKDMLAQMAAQAAISNFFGGSGGGGGGFFNDFFGGITQGFGGGGGAVGAAGRVVGNGGGEGGTGGITSLLGGVKGLAEGAKAFFAEAAFFVSEFAGGFTGFFAGSSGLTTAAGGAGSATNFAGGAGGFAGAGVTGLVTGLAVDALVGSRGDSGVTAILSTVGGIIGSIIPGIGTVIGAAIGGAIGGFVSNLIGGAKKLESATLEFVGSVDGVRANIETVTSKQRSFFRGRKFTTKNDALDVSGVNEVIDSLVSGIGTLSAALGVDADAALENFEPVVKEINIKGRSQEQIVRLLTDLFDEVLLGIIGEFVDNAEGLTARTQLTIDSFSGNVDEFVRAFEAAASIDLAFLIDPVQVVADAIEETNITLADSYDTLLEAYFELIDGYDGSLESLEALAQATAIVTSAQITLVAALTAVGIEASQLFQGSAQTIRESLLSEEELYNLRRSQIDDLVEQASMTTDPDELASLAEEINRLGLDAFNILDEEQQLALGPEFIEFFEGLDALFGSQVDLGIDQVLADQAEADLRVAAKMEEAAAAIIAAARALEEEARRRQQEEQDRYRGGEYR